MLRDNNKISSTSFFNPLDKSKILTQLFEDRVFVLNQVNSTNQYVIDHIKYIKTGDVFVAEYQTSGRGRYGKKWVAPFGKNICLSIYWRCHRIFSTVIEFSLMISIVIAIILQRLGKLCIKIKWPNDLYINERKLAGILIEMITRKNCVTHVIIGVGINVSTMIYTKEELEMNDIVSNRISLEDVGIIFDRNVLIANLVNVLRQKLKYFEYYGFVPFVPYWRNFDYLYKKSITLCIRNQSIHQGMAAGINKHGALMVKQSNKKISYYTEDDISVNVS